jgi:hypothetical protein
MDEAARGALASDDAQEQSGEDPTFRVRETSDGRSTQPTLRLKC